jgi:allophanate hydrolase
MSKTGISGQSLDLRSLLQAYRNGTTTPEAVIADIYQRIEQYADPAVWIYLAPLADSLAQAQALSDQDPADLPLYGIPFAIKDNIDWAGVTTTAGCPEFAYTPQRSATVVEKLCAAGAIPIGKTNLDQFATGLVGTRSPYGICRNPFDAAYIPGGSSAGSGAAVSAGLVSFALGTDTAGSGRVPAAFTNIIGLKPTKGYLSTRGVVPAVRSLDCVSIFTLTCADAAAVFEVANGFDPEDPFSHRSEQTKSIEIRDFSGLRVGVPGAADLDFFGNADAERNYYHAIAQLQALGSQVVTIDFQPFAETAQLLYEGAWVAERTAAVGNFLAQDHPGIDPVVRQIIMGGHQIDAVTTYQDYYRLKALQRQAQQQWQAMDILALPTTGTIYTIAQVQAEPFALNRNLGLYTNFVNLLDLSAIAIPSGFQTNELPTGITLMATAGSDRFLCYLGEIFHAQLEGNLGATDIPFAAITN